MACVQYRENWKPNGQKEGLLNAERVFQTFTENMLKWPFNGSCFHLFNPGYNGNSGPQLYLQVRVNHCHRLCVSGVTEVGDLLQACLQR